MASSISRISFDTPKPVVSAEQRRENARNRLLWIFYILCISLFLGAGALMLPLPGLQADEVMFLYYLWHPHEAMFSLSLAGHHPMPAMLMSYLGALKSWIYAPLLAFVLPSVWAIRLPALLLAALTILLTGSLLRRISGRTAAVFGVSLLATDVTFLTTAVFDWGPVVLQNLLLVAGMLLVLKWYRERNDLVLFLAGLAFGLNLWNKALFVWNLSGLVVALLLLALPEVMRVLRPKALAIFILGMALGCYPLLKFNLYERGATLGQNNHFALAAVGDKAAYLVMALNGQVSVTVTTDPQRKGRDHVHRAGEDLSLRLANGLRSNPSLWRCAIGLTLIFLGLIAANNTQRRWILFFLISGAIGWFESALTVDAGRSIHHTVLFWLNWYSAFALAAAALTSRYSKFARPLVAALIALLCLRGLLMMNLEYANLISYDPAIAWTNADETLVNRLSELHVTRALTVDWGIADVVGLRSLDKVSVSDQVFTLNAGNFDRDQFAECQAPACIIISHVPQRLVLAHATQVLDDALRTARFVKLNEAVVQDTHGFPAYSIFQLRDEQPNAPLPLTSVAAPPPLLQGAPTLIANPATLISPGGLGQTVLSWQVPAAMPVEVHVDSPDGHLFATSKGPGSSRTGFWVKNGMQFFLQDISDGKPRTAANTLARVTIEVRSH